MNVLRRIFNKYFVRLHGKNNYVDIDFDKKIFVKIYGDNNKVIIKNTKYYFDCKIYIGTYDCKVDNCTVIIGKNVSANGLTLHLMEDDSQVIIGEDAMFSFNVEIWASDTHSILDKSGNLTNIGKSVEIGNSVWVGQNALILKNTAIPNGCIVGTGSIVTKKFDKNDCVIAGNPAKIVKENITWSRLRPKQYLMFYQ